MQLAAFATDFGIESNVAKTKSIPLHLLCPYAVGMDMAPELEAPANADRADPFVQYNAALHIPGALHIIHNLTDNVLDAMEHFSEAKGPMIAPAVSGAVLPAALPLSPWTPRGAPGDRPGRGSPRGPADRARASRVQRRCAPCPPCP